MKVLNWVKKNRIETLLLVALLLTTLFLRLYKIDQYMTFLGDEGRDALVIKKILVEKDLPFIGPPTSVGNMYLGPLYYYMMALPMAISWLNPVAAAVMVAFIGTFSVGLIYLLARAWFGRLAAFSAAILYSLSPINIIYSRSSWNPNPAPFFSLLIILSLYLVHKTKNYKWLVLTGISFAFLIQMHYLALIMLPVIGVLWLYELLIQINKKKLKHSFFSFSMLGLLAFLLLMSPLFLFDLKYEFMNFKALSAFFGNRETTVNLNILNTLGRVLPIYFDSLIARYITFGNNTIAQLVPIIVLLPSVVFLFQIIIKKQFNWPIFALLVWLFGGVLGLALYKQNIYDHYIGFLNPAPYLLFASLFGLGIKNKLITKSLAALLIICVALITISNIQYSPIKKEPNNQLRRTEEVAKFVINESKGKPFNFALIAKSNYDDAYEFYLDKLGQKPKQVPFEVTDQLFVVCEDSVCQPIGNPKQEISHFGWAKIEYEKEFRGVKVFKLIHNPEENDQSGQK